MKKNGKHLIQEVYPGSIAEEMGIEPGDVLLADQWAGSRKMSLIIRYYDKG